ncbi:MAG: GNAT family N-acetyltransferase [Pseudomonadota bacterium]|nr:GNAT family N-acetyltransferase [Pseudomonadota bacterium]
MHAVPELFENEIELVEAVCPERQRIALAPYPVALTGKATLDGGLSYTVRAVRPDDEPAVLRLLARLNPEEVRLRFFAMIRHFSHEMAARITQVDYDRELTMAAISASDPGEIAALATLVSDSDGLQAEYAVLVHHGHAGKGLGRQLMQRLLQIAGDRGIRRVYGEVLADNMPMLTLAQSLGFAVSIPADDPGCRHVSIDITESLEPI